MARRATLPSTERTTNVPVAKSKFENEPSRSCITVWTMYRRPRFRVRCGGGQRLEKIGDDVAGVEIQVLAQPHAGVAEVGKPHLVDRRVAQRARPGERAGLGDVSGIGPVSVVAWRAARDEVRVADGIGE